MTCLTHNNMMFKHKQIIKSTPTLVWIAWLAVSSCIFGKISMNTISFSRLFVIVENK